MWDTCAADLDRTAHASYLATIPHLDRTAHASYLATIPHFLRNPVVTVLQLGPRIVCLDRIFP